MIRHFAATMTAAVYAVFAAAPSAKAHWIDVTVAAHGCPAAVPSDGGDDHAALQCFIDYTHAANDGGVLYFPPGHYHTSQTLMMPSAQMLRGGNRHTTSIQSLAGTDINVLRYNGSHNTFGGMADLTVICSQSRASVGACVQVSFNVPVRFSDCNIWGGKYALLIDGVDGRISDCTIAAMAENGVHLFSRGANWYVNTKFNGYAGQTVAYGYVQNTWPVSPNNGVQENHFVNVDFSGPFSAAAVGINDGGRNEAITAFSNSIFAGPVYIYSARVTLIGTTELGSPTFVSYSPVSLTGNYSLPGTTIGGPGARSCAGNIAIAC